MYVHTRRTYALGWVNLYLKKLKLKNIVFVVNSFYPKKMERHLKKKFIGTTGFVNLHGFANI